MWSPKGTSFVKIGPPVRSGHVTKKPIKTKNPYSDKLGICLDHPHHQTEMQFGMMGGIQLVVLSFKFHQNQPSGYQHVRGQNWPYSITLVNGLYNNLYNMPV